MRKYLSFLSVFLAVLSHAHAATGQSRSDPASAGEATFTATSRAPSRLSRTLDREVSAHARALAKQSYEMGVKYARAGFFRQAEESFKKALQLDPSYADAHYGIGQVYFDLGQLQEALKSFEQAVRFDPKNEGAYAKLAEVRLKLHTAANPPPQKENETAGVKVSLSDSSNSPTPNSATALRLKDDLTRVYRVGAGDVLEVRLGDAVPVQSTLFTVTASGLLEHPNLPEPMPVSGLTAEEIKVRLEDDLKRRAISEKPNVVVAIRDYLSHAILVSGLVKEPGTKLLRREAIPLYVVVADSQPLAEAGRLTLVQHESGETLSIDLSEPAQMNLLVRPGDVITVHPNPKQFFYVGGEVKSPGEKSFRPGLTLTQAVLVAEGLTRKAKEAQLARENGNGFLQVTRYKLKDINSGKLADPLIQPGDRITIVD